MFEKEAEERITEQFGTSGEYVTRQRIWQYGAEFGYNKAKEDADRMKSRFLELCNLKDVRIAQLEKANEWHSYAERPTEGVNALCFDSAQNQFILGYYDIESDEWIKYGGYETITIDMWKKIVLPEPKEGE